jgi:hypothetical protein
MRISNFGRWSRVLVACSLVTSAAVFSDRSGAAAESLTVTPNVDLPYSATVTVVADLSPAPVGGVLVPIQQCLIGPGLHASQPERCRPGFSVPNIGTYELTVVATYVDAVGGVVDCRVQSCYLTGGIDYQVLGQVVAGPSVALDFAPGDAVTVRGVVHDSSGEPIAGATVEGPAITSGISDGDGRYEVAAVRGFQAIVASGPAGSGYLTASQTIEAGFVGDVDFALVRGASIEGVVSDDAGNPIEGVTVGAAESVQESVTDSDGRYRIDGLTPDEAHTMYALPPDDSSFLEFPPPPDHPEPPAVTPGEGETVQYDIELELGGRVEVRFLNFSFADVGVSHGELCEAEDADPCYPLDVVDGRGVTFGGVPAGSYDLWVTDAVIGLERHGSVNVVAGEITEVQYLLEPSPVHGTITSNGAPVVGAEVEVGCDDDDLCPFTTVTDSDGAFAFDWFVDVLHFEVTPPVGVPFTRTDFDATLRSGRNDLAFELVTPATLRVIVPNAVIMGVDACEVDGPHCILGQFTPGQQIDLVGVHPGARYDLFVDAMVNGVLSTRVVTDVPVGAGFTTRTIVPGEDSDRDGSPDFAEPGDRNLDGVLDLTQLGVVTTGTSSFELVTVSRRGFLPTFDLSFHWMVAVRDPALVPSPPTDVDFPHGVVTARANFVAGSTVFELVLPDETEAFYAQSHEGWSRVDGAGLDGASVAGNQVRFRVFDGGRFDLDGAVDGRIQINVAPGTDGIAGAAIVGGPVGFVDGNDADFVIDAPEGASLRCSLDMAPFSDCAELVSLVDLAEGPHVFVVQPWVDGRAGVADFRWWFADAPPGVRAAGLPTGVTVDRGADFTFTGAADCMVDFVARVACDSVTTLTGLDVGPHVLLVFGGAQDMELTDLRYWVVHRPVDGAGATTRGQP